MYYVGLGYCIEILRIKDYTLNFQFSYSLLLHPFEVEKFKNHGQHSEGSKHKNMQLGQKHFPI